MESTILSFCKTLGSICNHIDSSTKSLIDSIQRRPIPLDSAASAFLQSLDRRTSTTGGDLDLLDSMAMGTVSFEELLGHFTELHRTNAKYIAGIQGRMESFGYVPEMELEDEDEEDLDLDSETLNRDHGSKGLEEELLFDDSLSLQNLGLSDACLATLAAEDDVYPESLRISSQNMLSHGDGQAHEETTSQPPKDGTDVSVGGATRVMISTSKGDYDSLPSYIRSLASWEELQAAVAKLNDYLFKKEGASGSNAFNEAQMETLGLGHKGRSYLLLLVRMKKLVMETVDGCIIYRAHVDCS
ncbi:uncharacterized protein M6B38_126770 [Iris pallida]|uniref:Spindle and kinetochore-associated protein 3 n=1 Tax=Iris pallida TaxID=29817 RepID=A0AAX6GG32_IRIPA|nr:uncharacterized protein M6B38_126770 [Iris pallida]